MTTAFQLFALPMDKFKSFFTLGDKELNEDEPAASLQYLHLHNARLGCYNCRVERV